MNYGERLKKIRKCAKLNQDELARNLNTKQGNISFWEKSTYPPLDAIEKICESLNVPLCEFFAHPGELENYVPSWITPKDMEVLKLLIELVGSTPVIMEGD